jgi:flavin-dependent dehydrogenase
LPSTNHDERITAVAEPYDVAILGGGLAGLSLGLQLARERPETSIVIVEKRAGPAPEAAFKVGESTVELSAFYFGEVLGLRDHLEVEQLPKIGLRFFFPADGNEDLALRPEWGAVEPPPVPAYQLDRGRFENELTDRNRALAGTDVVDGTTVEDVDLSEAGGDHVVMLSTGEAVRARWVIDATGPRQLLKRKLGLAKDVGHTVNASWLRVGGELDLERWVADEAWRERIAEPGLRRLATNHLMGEGYWVWLIPLASGSTSVGIVADPRFVPWNEIDTLDGALGWLKRNEPQLARELGTRRDEVADFLKVEDFAYSCERVFSPQRWAMTGVAGVFIDPFYSPGSDFIAHANTFITDMVTRDLDGGHDPERVELLNGAFMQLFAGVLELYEDKYEIWGDALPMSAKIGWDYAYYWIVMVPPFMHGKWHDVEFVTAFGPTLGRCSALNHAVQSLCRDWHRIGAPQVRGGFAGNKHFDALYDLHLGLRDRFDDGELVAVLQRKAEVLEGLAVAIFHKAAESLGDRAPDPTARVAPHAISLDPDRWEQDGLLTSDGGLTLAEALARVPGVEQLWFPGSTPAEAPARPHLS